MQRCGKHISAAMNQQKATEEAVFSVGAAPKLYVYNEDLRQLRDRDCYRKSSVEKETLVWVSEAVRFHLNCVPHVPEVT
jgi:hypothetical protein